MNNTVYYDFAALDAVRRQHLYDRQLFVFSPRRSILEFVAFARSMIEDAFGDLDPRIAQYSTAVERYAALLGKLKPTFIHHCELKRHLQAILEDLGCDLEKTYFDIPRMRSSTSSNYLTTGIAMPGTPTATGIRRPPVSLAGGCRFTSFNPIMRWRFIRGIGASPSRTAPRTTITIPGTSCIAARMSLSSSRKICDRYRAPSSLSRSIRRST